MRTRRHHFDGAKPACQRNQMRDTSKARETERRKRSLLSGETLEAQLHELKRVHRPKMRMLAL
jgi:hypothetical protein